MTRFWFRRVRGYFRKSAKRAPPPVHHSVTRFRCDVASTRDRSRRRATRVDPRRDAIDRGRSPSVGSRSPRSARAVASGRTRRAGPARARSRPALNPPDDDERGFRRSLKGEFLFSAGVHRRGAPVNWYRAPVDWYRVSGDPQPGVADRIRTKTARGRRFAPRSVPSVTDCTIERPIDESL